jgi:hypothetical protein
MSTPSPPRAKTERHRDEMRRRFWLAWDKVPIASRLDLFRRWMQHQRSRPKLFRV